MLLVPTIDYTALLEAVEALKTVDAVIADLKTQAFTDDLTGLYNQRAYVKTAKEWNITDPDWKVYVFDLDGLKQVNDKKGHVEGDKLIIKAALKLLSMFRRDEDLVFRYGGDEFYVITKHTPAELTLDCELFSWGCADIVDGDINNALIEADVEMYQHKSTRKCLTQLSVRATSTK